VASHCGECGDPCEDTYYLTCQVCRQQYHCDCIGVENSAADDEFEAPFQCDACNALIEQLSENSS
jgi:hypothetical protein